MTALSVMVVDDDAMLGALLSAMLEEMGYTVCALETTQAGAVAAAKRTRPDLMIVDAWLGEGSGVAAVDEILRGDFVPHLFISGNVARVTSLRPDAVVLGKPFREGQLARAIQRALEADPALDGHPA